MDQETAMEGHSVSFREASAELTAHGVTNKSAPGGIMALEEWQDGSEWRLLPLDSAQILEWLGY